MKIEKLKLSQIKCNEANPREIKQDKFRKLVDSILVFPKMLGVRPVVVDKTFKALGGNMRTKALNHIAGMSIEAIADRLCTVPDFADKTAAEQQKLVVYWSDWLDNPTVPTIKAEGLTEDEKQQFIIKDNVSYGTWDYNDLANKWDSAQLQSWGMDVWSDKPASSTTDDDQPLFPEQEQESAEDNEFADALPPELQGVNLTPDKLEKIKGDDERPNDYIIITYLPEDKEKLVELLGIKPENYTDKICYTLDEINFMREG